MSWTLNASGHVPSAVPAEPVDPPAVVSSGQDAAAVEMELYEALKAVLADPKYGTAASSFGGSHVSGSLHLADS